MANKRTKVANNQISSSATLKYYWSLVKTRVILGLILMVLVKIYMIIRYGLLLALDRSGGFDWLIAVFIFILVGFRLSRYKTFSNIQVSITGAVAGFSLGLLVAIVDVALFRNLWAVWNLARKPLIFMIIGMAVVVITYLFKYRENKKPINKTKN